jgi:hypothetical protein
MLSQLENNGEGPIGRLLPASMLGYDLGGTGANAGRRTIGRRIKTDPDFPQVYRINGRLYVREGDWEAYKKILLRRGVAAAPVAARHPLPNSMPRPEAPHKPPGRPRKAAVKAPMQPVEA